MKRILFLIILGWAVLQGLKAQTDAALSHYFMATAYYNPAAAGSTEDLKMLALFNRQWVGFPNAQQSFFVTADMPLKIGKTNHGIGIAAYTEVSVCFRYIRRCPICYKQKLFGGVLSGGLQIGFVTESFKADSIYIPQSPFHQQEDEAFPKGTVSGMGLDLNVGLFYTHKNFYAGIGYTMLPLQRYN